MSFPEKTSENFGDPIGWISLGQINGAKDWKDSPVHADCGRMLCAARQDGKSFLYCPVCKEKT